MVKWSSCSEPETTRTQIVRESKSCSNLETEGLAPPAAQQLRSSVPLTREPVFSSGKSMRSCAFGASTTVRSLIFAKTELALIGAPKRNAFAGFGAAVFLACPIDEMLNHHSVS